MSDTASTPTPENTDPWFRIRVNAATAKESEDYTTHDWRELLTDTMHHHAEGLRAVRFVRYALLAPAALVINHVLHHYGKGLPGWIMSVAMVVLVMFPVSGFRALLQELQVFTTPVRIARFFEILGKNAEGKTIWANAETAEFALRKLFDLNIPTRITGKGKIKPVKGAVDPYPGVMHVSDNLAAQRRIVWIAVNTMVLALILGSGAILNIVFVVTFLVAVIATARYRKAAMQPLRSFIAHEDTDNTAPTASADDEDDEDIDSMPTTPVDEETAELLALVAKYHRNAPLTDAESLFLNGLFPTGVPTAEQLMAEIKSAQPTTPAVTALAVDSTTTPEDTAVRPALPVRNPRPTHTNPVSPVAPSAPEPDDIVVPPVTPVAPVPAPTTPSIPETTQNLLKFYHEGWPLAEEEMDIIRPYLNNN